MESFAGQYRVAKKPIHWQRSLFHLVSGLTIAVAAIFLSKTIVLIALASITFMFLCFELVRIRTWAVNKWFLKFFKYLTRTGETTNFTGASYLLIASLISFIYFPKNVAIMAIAFLAVGDSMAGLVGRWIGGRPVFGKTLAGVLAGFCSCLIIGAILYFTGINLPWQVVLIGAVLASLVEAIPLPLNDNLSMPLISGLIMSILYLNVQWL
jgi:acyl phosphate:glycerol-3-phosphate acyltransferase